MASKTVALNTVAVLVETAPEHKKIVVSGITIDDPVAGAKTITFTDVFTTDTSNGAATTSVTSTWRQLTSPGGINEDFDFSKRRIELFGAVYVTSSVTSATSMVTIDYELE